MIHPVSAPRRQVLTGVAAALLLIPGRTSVTAQSAPATQPAPITLSLRDVPLRTALETLFNGSGLQHAVEPAVPNYPLTLDIREVPFSTALRTLLRLAPGVTYRKEGDIYVVGMRQPPADQPATQDVQPPEQTAAQPEYQYEKVPLNFTHYEVMAYVLGGQPIPTENQLSGGGSGGIGGGYGGGIGGLSGGGYGGGGFGGGLGGGFGGGGFGGGGLGGGLGGFGGGGLGGGFGGGGFGGGGLGGGGFGGGLGGGFGGGLGGGLGGFGGGGLGGYGGGGLGGFTGPRINRF